VNKSEAIKLLNNEGWTKKDAERALAEVNFKNNPDELTLRRAISSFAGSELINRQRLQSAQRGLVTKKKDEMERQAQEYASKINQYERSRRQEREKYETEIQNLLSKNVILETKTSSVNPQDNDLIEVNKQLKKDNSELIKINEQLKKDNKDLKNIVDMIKLRLAQDTNKLLKYEDSEIRKAVVQLFKWTLG
jgi:vacuolar-type H+-ATPase subunit I/STV1